MTIESVLYAIDGSGQSINLGVLPTTYSDPATTGAPQAKSFTAQSGMTYRVGTFDVNDLLDSVEITEDEATRLLGRSVAEVLAERANR